MPPIDINNQQEKLIGARELLATSKRNLQLVDEQLVLLQDGRSAVTPAEDVSTEHRIAFLGAVDDNTHGNGISFISGTGFGFQFPRNGTIRNQEDAAFVCTKVLVALATSDTDGLQFVEDAMIMDATSYFLPMLRLTDGNTGRSLLTGMTVNPLDKDRGAVAFSYFSSIRPGLGSNVKNKLFSEFTIPRAGAVRVEVFNVGNKDIMIDVRAFVTLLGFKVYGG